MKKGAVSQIGGMLLVLVVLIAAFIIFFAFQRGAFFQEKVQIYQAIESTGDLPCYKAPVVSINPVTLISPNVKDTVNLSASLGSSCFEALDVQWDFKDINPPGTGTIVKNECTFSAENNIYGIYNNTTNEFNPFGCSKLNHTYNAETKDIWQTFPITVSAFGLRSGSYTAAESSGFVKDPLFKVINTSKVDASDFSCIKLQVGIEHTNIANGKKAVIKDPGAEDISLELFDKSKLIEMEHVAPTPSVSSTDIIYRAPWQSGNHSITLTATKQYQTTKPLELSYDVILGQKTTGRPEAVVLRGGTAAGDIGVYSTKAPYSSAPINGSLFPDAGGHDQKDFSIADLDKDRVGEFIFLIASETDNVKGHILVQSYANLKRSLGKELNELTLEQLERMWPSFSKMPDASKEGWRTVAGSYNGVKTSDNRLGNIVALGEGGSDPSILGLYKYSSVTGSITEVERGNDLPSFGEWNDFALIDLNNDQYDDVMLLNFDGNMQSIGVFSYINRMKLKEVSQINSTKYMMRLPQTSSSDSYKWKWLAVGRDALRYADQRYFVVLGENSKSYSVCYREFPTARGNEEVNAITTNLVGASPTDTNIGGCDAGSNYDNYGCCTTHEFWEKAYVDANTGVTHNIVLKDVAIIPNTATDGVLGVPDNIAFLYTDNNQYKIAILNDTSMFNSIHLYDYKDYSNSTKIIPISSTDWSHVAAGDVACV